MIGKASANPAGVREALARARARRACARGWDGKDGSRSTRLEPDQASRAAPLVPGLALRRLKCVRTDPGFLPGRARPPPGCRAARPCSRRRPGGEGPRDTALRGRARRRVNRGRRRTAAQSHRLGLPGRSSREPARSSSTMPPDVTTPHERAPLPGGMSHVRTKWEKLSRTIFRRRANLSRMGYGIHTLKVGGAHRLPPSAREASGGEGRLGRSPSGVGGASPRRFVDDQARVSMAALAQPPHHPRHPRASPSHPPPLPLPATRLRRAGGGRSEKPTCVNPVARSGEGFVPLKHRG